MSWIIFCSLLAAVGYTLGWLHGRDAERRESNRRVFACKVWWCGILDTADAEHRRAMKRHRRYEKFLEASAAEAHAENHMLKATRAAVGGGKN